jgi:hypothetical protein
MFNPEAFAMTINVSALEEFLLATDRGWEVLMDCKTSEEFLELIKNAIRNN